MNPLQKHPQLFVNGKFRLMFDHNGKCEHEYKLLGYERNDNNDWYFKTVHGYRPVKDFTLIARPISDMTDEERNKWDKACKESNDHAMLYALSIGCLPKIFEHCFDDGTVIDSTTL